MAAMDCCALSLFMLVCFGFLSTQTGICEGGQSHLQSQDFISWGDLRVDSYAGNSNLNEGGRSRIIVVAKDGTGDSKTVQGAVDMVPAWNKERVKIFISAGVYREKVLVPATKPYVSFIGKGSSETVISWHLKASDPGTNGETVGTYDSASVAVEADYFCASGLAFENTAPAAKPGAQGMQAVALRLSGDKAVLHGCRILGTQDTLFDHIGRHYFLQCYIQGSIDFVFGSARSLYKDCQLRAVAASFGAIAASQRNSPSEDSGFSFLGCRLTGTGMLYLGRAWGKYARVVYSMCQLEGIIIPEGWSDWGDPSRRRTVLFGEFNCTGKGAELKGRTPWARSLTYEEARPYLNSDYIDGEQWLKL